LTTWRLCTGTLLVSGLHRTRHHDRRDDRCGPRHLATPRRPRHTDAVSPERGLVRAATRAVASAGVPSHSPMAVFSCAAPTRPTIALAMLVRRRVCCNAASRAAFKNRIVNYLTVQPHGGSGDIARGGRAAAPRGGSVPLITRDLIPATNRAAPGGSDRAARRACGRDEPCPAKTVFGCT
jgi:hypothetical protein